MDTEGQRRQGDEKDEERHILQYYKTEKDGVREKQQQIMRQFITYYKFIDNKVLFTKFSIGYFIAEYNKKQLKVFNDMQIDIRP